MAGWALPDPEENGCHSDSWPSLHSMVRRSCWAPGQGSRADRRPGGGHAEPPGLRAQIDGAGEASHGPLSPSLCAGGPGPRIGPKHDFPRPGLAQAPHFPGAHILTRAQCTHHLHGVLASTENHSPGHTQPPGLSTGHLPTDECTAPRQGLPPPPSSLLPMHMPTDGREGGMRRGVPGCWANLPSTHYWACCNLSFPDPVSDSHTVGGPEWGLWCLCPESLLHGQVPSLKAEAGYLPSIRLELPKGSDCPTVGSLLKAGAGSGDRLPPLPETVLGSAHPNGVGEGTDSLAA